MGFGLTVVIIASIIALYNFIDLVLRHQREMRNGGDAMGEIEALKERVRVLERITVEEGHSLASEIERLREPVGLPEPARDEINQLDPARDKSTSHR